MRFRFRSLPVLVLLVLAGLAATAAFATPPTDQGPGFLSGVPDCVAGAQIDGGAQQCKVHPFASLPWQAPTGTWIVIRAVEYVFGTSDDHAACLAVQASEVATITIDGKSLPVDVIPCAQNPDLGGLWTPDYRALSHPLTPGTHTIVETLTFTHDVVAGGSVIIPAGTVLTPTGTLTVVQGKK